MIPKRRRSSGSGSAGPVEPHSGTRSYHVGSVEDRSGKSEREPAQLFTNASGRFFIEGVEAGKSYTVSLDLNGTTTRVIIDAPPGIVGIYSLADPVMIEVDAASPPESHESGS